MRASVAFLLLSALLSGCADEPADPSAGTDSTGDGQDGDTVGGAGNTEPKAPQYEEKVVPVSFEGTLGNQAAGCSYDAQTCFDSEDHNPSGRSSDYYHEEPGATWVAADLTMTWDSPSPATDSLVLGVMRMGDNSTSVANQEGTSPNTVQDDDMDLMLDENNLIHIYVYNGDGFHSAEQGYAYLSPNQAFKIEGTLTLMVPMDAPS